MNSKLVSCTKLVGACMLTAPAASAQIEATTPEPDSAEAIDEYGETEPAQRRDRLSPVEPYRIGDGTIGMSATIGGGVSGFLDGDARDFSELGGTWDVRLVFGTRTIVAGELAYIGSGRDVAALGLDSSALLVSHGAEVAARLHLLPGLIRPYVLAGAGFTRYQVANEDSNTSSGDDADYPAHLPVGLVAALSYRRCPAGLR